MQSPVISVIGAGNMGSCLIGGLIKNGHPANKIWASDADEQKLTHLSQTLKIHVTTNNAEAALNANILIFAVKPQLFASVASALSTVVQQQHPLIISIAAGVTIASIEAWLGGKVAVVRSMPNTPALIGCGATALYANRLVTSTQHAEAETIMRSLGLIVWLAEEKQMDVVTALSGSGPAYFFLMMESLQKSAEQLGLPPATAKLLTLQTALGSAQMALESDKSLEELRQVVTSPGGTTERGVSVLEESNIREIYYQTLLAAKTRSEELAKK